jgi:hypothetical protein
LHDWRRRHPEYAAGEAPISPTPIAADPVRYLDALRLRTAYIDIRGLQVGTGKAHRFPIEELYIPLNTAGVAEREYKGNRAGRDEPSRHDAGWLAARSTVALQAILKPGCRAVVVGDPGSGKSTFLRRVAHALAETALGVVPDATQGRLGIPDTPSPILVRLVDVAEPIDRTRTNRSPGQPPTAESAAWLRHYLAAVAEAENWGLTEEFFSDQLKAGASWRSARPPIPARLNFPSSSTPASSPWTTRPLRCSCAAGAKLCIRRARKKRKPTVRSCPPHSRAGPRSGGLRVTR